MEDLVYRLRKRAEIRRTISTRKSVQEGKEDKISNLLDEAADELEKLQKYIQKRTQFNESSAQIPRHSVKSIAGDW